MKLLDEKKIFSKFHKILISLKWANKAILNVEKDTSWCKSIFTSRTDIYKFFEICSMCLYFVKLWWDSLSIFEQLHQFLKSA